MKTVGIALDREADKQVVSYALSKRVQFAVSTNFETLKIFCVEQRGAIQNNFRVFSSPADYVSNLTNLMLLSKESFVSGKTLAQAVNEDRLKKRITIDDVLLDDLMRMRSLIANDIEKKYPEKYDINERDQIIQRIIDRLIFIRRCEDIGINPKNLVLEEVEHLPHDDAYPRLKKIFSIYDDVYNSGLFVVGADSDVDRITIDGAIIKESYPLSLRVQRRSLHLQFRLDRCRCPWASVRAVSWEDTLSNEVTQGETQRRPSASKGAGDILHSDIHRGLYCEAHGWRDSAFQEI